jgi:hypothetical protein
MGMRRSWGSRGMPQVERDVGAKAPSDAVAVLGAALGVLAAGSAIAAVLPEPTLWMLAAAYLAPASLAFAIHWWISQRV